MGVAAWAGLALTIMGGVAAHPAGNESVNQYVGLRVAPDRVVIDYVLDFAELPTYQMCGAPGSSCTLTPAEQVELAGDECRYDMPALRLTVDGRPLPFEVDGSLLEFRPGAGGLATLRVECSYSAPVTFSGLAAELSFANENYPDSPGWREVTAVGDGTTLVSSSVPAESASGRLTVYPDSMLSSPPAVSSATLVVRPGGQPGTDGADSAGRADGGSNRFGAGTGGLARTYTNLVAHQRLGLGFGMLALLVAVALGAAHAVAPGHGKTLIAAYLVAERGSLRQAAVMGLTVTATHTFGVLAVGVLMTTALAVAPSRLYPWLGAASGLLIAGTGVYLVRRALATSRSGRRHRHHGHSHPHHPHPHSVAGPAVGTLGRRGLVAMGIAGGLVPSPSALVVLLGGIAIGRAWFGLALVIAYGLGLALTLMALGMAVVRARGWLERWDGRGSHRSGRARPNRVVRVVHRAAPITAASFVVLAGLGVVVRALWQFA